MTAALLVTGLAIGEHFVEGIYARGPRHAKEPLRPGSLAAHVSKRRCRNAEQSSCSASSDVLLVRHGAGHRVVRSCCHVTSRPKEAGSSPDSARSVCYFATDAAICGA